MKGYFTASRWFERQDLVLRIYEELEKGGIEHTSAYVTEIQKHLKGGWSDEYYKKFYSDHLQAVVKAQICFFEVSEPSIGLGQVLQEAVRREKPVVGFWYKGCKEPFLFMGMSDEENRVLRYEYSENNLEEVVEYAVEMVRELLTVRFTMLLPSEYNQYLDKVHEDRGISRSDYLRNLIKKDMESEVK